MDPAIPQLSSVTSESLQAQIRRLLPSQQGFGVELAATNVITPIIDLTATAEGSTLPESLQQALSLNSQTAFKVNNTTSTLINNTGFYRVIGTIGGRTGSSRTVEGSFALTDGATTKIVYGLDTIQTTTLDPNGFVAFDFIVFLATGDSLTGTANLDTSLFGSTRQVASVNGTLVNPSGFSFE